MREIAQNFCKELLEILQFGKKLAGKVWKALGRRRRGEGKKGGLLVIFVKPLTELKCK